MRWMQAHLSNDVAAGLFGNQMSETKSSASHELLEVPFNVCWLQGNLWYSLLAGCVSVRRRFCLDRPTIAIVAY